MKTNYQMCKSFVYDPKQRGFSTEKEIEQIEKHFNIKNRQDIELQNLRDFVVMFYSNLGRNLDVVLQKDEYIDISDTMSAIVGVIDNEKWMRGIPV